MPLLVVPATTADIPRIIVLEHDAYANNPFMPILFPGPFNTAGKTRAQELAGQWREDGTSDWVKVVDTDIVVNDSKDENPIANGNEIAQARETDRVFPVDQSVAFANWYIHSPDAKPPSKRAFGQGCNVEACELLFGGLGKQRQRLLANEGTYAWIQTLIVDPAHQRRGVGGRILDSIKAEAEKKGLAIYLQASPQGRELYLKNGFSDIECHELDMSKWNGGIHRTWIMSWTGGKTTNKR